MFLISQSFFYDSNVIQIGTLNKTLLYEIFNVKFFESSVRSDLVSKIVKVEFVAILLVLLLKWNEKEVKISDVTKTNK